jgi:TetR/AcrR family transcriptional repressor of nem operon
VQRQSIYNAYGDKRGLFLAVAARYRAHSAEALAPLTGPRVGVHDIRRYFVRFLRMVRENGCGSCLMVRTAFSHALTDERIREIVDQSSAEVRTAFAHAIENAIRRRELPPKTDAAAEAAYLFGSLHGLTALVQTGGSARDAAAALERVFERLL